MAPRASADIRAKPPSAVNHRHFLKLASGAVAASALPVLAACQGPAPQRPSPFGSHGAIVWSKLSSALGDRLVRPQDAGYASARQVYNARYDQRRPAGVALCQSVEDVQACLGFARQSGVRPAPRSGGHGYAGYSAPDDGLVVDVGHLNTIEVDASRASPDQTAFVHRNALFSAQYIAYWDGQGDGGMQASQGWLNDA